MCIRDRFQCDFVMKEGVQYPTDSKVVDCL